jgi:uncharacterized protein YjeT (DUF2065 family)
VNVFLPFLQVALAVVFLLHGLLSLAPPKAMRRIMEQTPFSSGFLRFIGVAEILAAFGLTLPGWTGILPPLTPLAAAGLAIIMVGAVVFHLSRRETPPSLVTAALLALVAFVAFMRWFVIPL